MKPAPSNVAPIIPAMDWRMRGILARALAPGKQDSPSTSKLRRTRMRSRVAAFSILLALTASPATAQSRPNIVLAVADDWSFPHAGIHGDRTVSTPNFDRVAREGARFTHAFVASPSCTPSRAALLTGQAVHRLEEGGNLHGFLPKAYPVYPDLLEQAGYRVGYTGKGWGPGRFEPGGRARNPAGPQFKNFDAFMQQRPKGSPFCFWFGSNDPHRPYELGTGAQSGLKPEGVQVPPFLPDTLEVRNDLLDYYFEVQRFDRDLGHIIEVLERAGELDNTILIVTSDNGMPFPRAKANVYDGGMRVPLAIRWRGVARAGVVIDAFVSLTDLAPTVLESAGLKPLDVMTGRTMLPLLRGGSQPARDRVFVERERHANVRRGDLSYPVRGIRTNDYLYIRNFRPGRWPAGAPVFNGGGQLLRRSLAVLRSEGVTGLVRRASRRLPPSPRRTRSLVPSPFRRNLRPPTSVLPMQR